MAEPSTPDLMANLRASLAALARCPSCEHQARYHQPEGCWYTVTAGTIDQNSVCPCAANWPPSTPEGDR